MKLEDAECGGQEGDSGGASVDASAEDGVDGENDLLENLIHFQILFLQVCECLI